MIHSKTFIVSPNIYPEKTINSAKKYFEDFGEVRTNYVSVDKLEVKISSEEDVEIFFKELMNFVLSY